MILKSLSIDFEPVDIAAPGMERSRDHMREKGKKKEGQRNVLPPQIFNGENYCGVSEEDSLQGHNNFIIIIFLSWESYVCVCVCVYEKK